MHDNPEKTNAGLQETVGNSSNQLVQSNANSSNNNIQIPEISLPTGGGAIKGIEEKFQVNAVTGTSSFGIPIPLSPSRGGFMPSVGLGYNSGSGNSPFGLGWNVGIPAITRKTEKKLPEYKDAQESDTFIFSGAEDLVPLLEQQGSTWTKRTKPRTENNITYTVSRYRPRIEGSFTRIEKWKNNNNGETHWRTISSDNIHSYYGLTSESRISDPHNDDKVFEWLLCRTHDDKGNIILYQYKEEDFLGIPKKLSEKNKLNNCTQTYIKKILYGNKQPYYLGDSIPEEKEFMFKVIFDYGEHDDAPDIPKNIDLEKKEWGYRKDVFSFYRAGFEIRTYRRCNRVMVFHCFDATELPHTPYLVKSLELFYDDELQLIGNSSEIEGFSFLKKARQNGHKWDAVANHYITKHLPDLDLTYQLHEWNTKIERVSEKNSIHAPIGINDRQYLWVDLFSEGISGILTEKANGWFYKSNLGNGNFSNAKQVAPKPSLSGLSTGLVTIQDLESNGTKYLVKYENQPKGFFKLTSDEEWKPFKNFESIPNIDTRDPNMRPIDLNGDGLADLLFTEENKMRWYPGAGEKGFEVSRTVTKAIDEEKGPAILFEDRSQSIFLADMNGDGLTDIVRIRNGQVCYWPNLGYGHFGAKANMDNAPLFDYTGKFNPAYLRLADIDGSGTIDIVYLGKNDFRVWMNINGNAWTKQPQIITPFPHINNLSDVSVIDFLGTGTACIVYSSPLPQDAQNLLQYIDLMASKKPNLLIGYQNNTGKEVSIEYKSSTHFYLEDKKAGNAWITKLPFPVHCIYKTTVEDKIRETIFTSSYRYRHGYFDPYEREFRGFARVEQLDTEAFSQFKVNNARNVVEESLHQAPVRTISWFHTGAYLRNKAILHQCQHEYFNNTEFDEYDLPEAIIEANLSIQELKEAYRACKGTPLRTETYAEDDTEKSNIPYSASQTSIEIRKVQPQERNKHASFQILPAESISYSYERNPADPRIGHSYILETDELGNVTKSAAIVYSRIKRPVAPNAIPDKVWEEQSKFHITFAETLFTNDILKDDVYRLRTSYESKSYELSGITQPADFFINTKTLVDDIAVSTEILFEEEFTAGLEKRLVSHNRAYFLKDDLTAALPLGQLSDLAIGHKSYQLAYTKNLVSKHYGNKVTDAMLTDAKYEHSEGDEHWWVHSGTALYQPDPKTNFYTPIGAKDIFGNESFVEYDRFTLLSNKTTDAIGNTATANNDYRTLSPTLLTDPNLNRAAVETDELGLVIKSAVMGKAGADEGDTLADPTVRMEYDLFNWQNNKKPNVVHAFAREQHGAANPRWQESYTYSDGGGNVIMSKSQAEAGKAKKWDVATQQVIEVDADPRWVGNGRAILNNKGNPVKQYEPYHSDTHEYESEDALVETGVTPIIFYDPVDRVVATLHPDYSWEKIVFDSWQQKIWDQNDTLLITDPRTDPHVGAYFQLLPESDFLPTWFEQRQGGGLGQKEKMIANKAAMHANTPSVVHFDSLGRAFFTITHNKYKQTDAPQSDPPVEEFAQTQVVFDITGNQQEVIDAQSRTVMQYDYDMSGNIIHEASMDTGQRWMFANVLGNPLHSWDERDFEFQYFYDNLHRPIQSKVLGGDGANNLDHIVERVFYGESEPSPETKNLRGQVVKLYDTGGLLETPEYDFKGQAKFTKRNLFKHYKKIANWVDSNLAQNLEAESFTFMTQSDALGRISEQTGPDGSVITPGYNKAGLLESEQIKHGDANQTTRTYIKNIDYNEKGQRSQIIYGNDVITRYIYDIDTFRLKHLVSKKGNKLLQDLHYSYDPVGNIAEIEDKNIPTVFFNQQKTTGVSTYTYDALYRLIEAKGRENNAALAFDSQDNWNDAPYMHQVNPGDPVAIRNYIQRYYYDNVGNILQMQHQAGGNDWKRDYTYETDNNRLKNTKVGSDTFTYPHHSKHGYIESMPHLQEMAWNFNEQLVRTICQMSTNGGTPETTYYQYDGSGQRIRKITEKQTTAELKEERIYIAGYEVYKKHSGSHAGLVRISLSLMDEEHRFVMIERRNDIDDDTPKELVRYQMHNHLGSSALELDQHAKIISYEEYHPYGTTAYQAMNKSIKVSAKRYRHTGMERDEESGLSYHSARYYLPWLGRWLSADPIGIGDGVNIYRYTQNNPLKYSDQTGTDARLTIDQESRTISYNTTVHFFGTAEEIAKIRPFAQQATDFFSNPSIETQTETDQRLAGISIRRPRRSTFTDVNGDEWQVRYDVTFAFHDTSQISSPLASQTTEEILNNVPETERTLASSVGFVPGDNILQFASNNAMTGGVTTLGTRTDSRYPAFGEPVSRMIANISSAGGHELQSLIHETGHLLGFDERYNQLFILNTGNHPQFEHDLMSGAGGDSSVVTMHPAHIEASAVFAIGVANGRNLVNQPLRGLQVESTRQEINGGTRDLHQFGNNATEYQTRQQQLRSELLPHFRNEVIGLRPLSSIDFGSIVNPAVTSPNYFFQPKAVPPRRLPQLNPIMLRF